MKIAEKLTRIKVNPRYKVINVLWVQNGCCPDLPVLVTASRLRYSCQCACGCWCTTGTSTPAEAIEHYQRMTDGATLYGGFLNYIV